MGDLPTNTLFVVVLCPYQHTFFIINAPLPQHIVLRSVLSVAFVATNITLVASKFTVTKPALQVRYRKHILFQAFFLHIINSSLPIL